MKTKQVFEKLNYCSYCESNVCPECKACWSKDCIECMVRLSIQILNDGKPKTLPRCFGLKNALDKVLPKMSDMDRKIIEKRRNDIGYLKQCRVFLLPLIRELKGEKIKRRKKAKTKNKSKA